MGSRRQICREREETGNTLQNSSTDSGWLLRVYTCIFMYSTCIFTVTSFPLTQHTLLNKIVLCQYKELRA